MFVYSSVNPNLQLFLDEAIWRIQNKSYTDRVNFLVQLNSFYGNGEQSFKSDMLAENSRYLRIKEMNSINFNELYESIYD